VETPAAPPEGPTWERLEDQIDWYERRSVANQRAFKQLKAVELVLAAAIPLVAGFDAPGLAAGVLGALVVVLEGVQQLGQFQQNWLTYRSTAEALKHEKYLYLARAGPYGGRTSHRRLAERVEALVSQEHARWVSAREEALGDGES